MSRKRRRVLKPKQQGHYMEQISIASIIVENRFRKDMGGLVESYTEVARRLGILNESEQTRPSGPTLVK